jgi:hypothetical protein
MWTVHQKAMPRD